MIRRLRARHRTWTLLAFSGAGALFAVTLTARPDATVADLLQAGVQVDFEGSLRKVERVTPDGELHAVLSFDGTRLRVLDTDGTTFPDVLVYWAPTTATDDRLPDQARLLGPLAELAQRASAVGDASTADPPGQLYFYSLGHAALVGTTDVPTD